MLKDTSFSLHAIKRREKDHFRRPCVVKYRCIFGDNDLVLTRANRIRFWIKDPVDFYIYRGVGRTAPVTETETF